MIFDEYGNRIWAASSEGDGMCPVCKHDETEHRGAEGCHALINYDHINGDEWCACPLAPMTIGNGR